MLHILLVNREEGDLQIHKLVQGHLSEADGAEGITLVVHSSSGHSPLRLPACRGSGLAPGEMREAQPGLLPLSRRIGATQRPHRIPALLSPEQLRLRCSVGNELAFR